MADPLYSIGDTRVIKFLGRLARHPAVGVPLAMLAAAGLLVLLLGPVSWWATPAKHLQGKDKADVRNATRQIVLAAVGGMVLLTGAAFTARTFFLTRRGQFTDRYTKAIGQIASDKLTERLGGIYALEHLMIESERDHNTVVEVLAAFIRENAESNSVHGGPPTPSTDIQAALTVLGRRPDRPEANYLDLRNADLRGANLQDARLEGAILRRAQLQDADMTLARLQHSDMRHAQLQKARMGYAVLRRADLTHANLDGAILSNTWLQGTNLNETNGLVLAQLSQSSIDTHTYLDPRLLAKLRDEISSVHDLDGVDRVLLRKIRGTPLDRRDEGPPESSLTP